MGIITISRGSYSQGKEIAEKLSEELGYKCVSREILLETSDHFNIPEIKLSRAIHDAPSILNRLQHGKERFIAYIRETLLEHIQQDNVIYHGLAGQFLLHGIPNILKVRIIADFDERVQEEMKLENITQEEARHTLAKDDEERRKWSMRLYGIDTNDCSLYDVVLHIDNLKIEEAVEILADIAKRQCFRMTPESKQIIREQYLGAKVFSKLVVHYPDAKVICKEDTALVNVETTLAFEEKTRTHVIELAGSIDGIKQISVNTIPIDI